MVGWGVVGGGGAKKFSARAVGVLVVFLVWFVCMLRCRVEGKRRRICFTGFDGPSCFWGGCCRWSAGDCVQGIIGVGVGVWGCIVWW